MELIIFAAMMVLGYTFGRINESRHYKSIQNREAEFANLPVIPIKRLPDQYNHAGYDSALVGGNVVVSVDYFKVFSAGLRNLIGGRVISFESLIDRGRREALLRMMEDAMSHDAECVINIKYETSSISKNSRQAIGCIEVYAYGTALIPVRETQTSGFSSAPAMA